VIEAPNKISQVNKFNSKNHLYLTCLTLLQVPSLEGEQNEVRTPVTTNYIWHKISSFISFLGIHLSFVFLLKHLLSVSKTQNAKVILHEYVKQYVQQRMSLTQE
jgi:hypothetical protein